VNTKAAVMTPKAALMSLSPTRRPTRVTEREEPLTEEVASFPETMDELLGEK